jgi:mRNA interferase RelE/StbE
MKESRYSIDMAPRTQDQLEKIPKDIRGMILERIEKLGSDPRPPGVEPLQGSNKGLFRIRQGDYRIVYSVQDKILLILVVRVVHRKEVYKKKHSK